MKPTQSFQMYVCGNCDKDTYYICRKCAKCPQCCNCSADTNPESTLAGD